MCLQFVPTASMQESPIFENERFRFIKCLNLPMQGTNIGTLVLGVMTENVSDSIIYIIDSTIVKRNWRNIF